MTIGSCCMNATFFLLLVSQNKCVLRFVYSHFRFNRNELSLSRLWVSEEHNSGVHVTVMWLQSRQLQPFCRTINRKGSSHYYLFCCSLVVIQCISSSRWVVLLQNSICTWACKPCILKWQLYSVVFVLSDHIC